MTTELGNWNRASRMRKFSPMTNPLIDWESLIENTEFDHVLYKEGGSFYQRQVFKVRASDQEEELAESIVA